jgi:hypothetical protein
MMVLILPSWSSDGNTYYLIECKKMERVAHWKWDISNTLDENESVLLIYRYSAN